MNISEAENIKNKVDYTDCVRYLSENDALTVYFLMKVNQDKMFYLDTTYCVTGKRKKKYNSLNIYAIFGAYVNKTPEKVKELMLDEISSNRHWYIKAGTVTVGMRNMNFDQWFKSIKPKKAHGDELCVYALSMLFRRHTVIHSSLRPWTTVKLKTGMTSGMLLKLCETHLLYLGNGAYGELFRKSINLVCPPPFVLEDLQEKRNIYRDHNIPIMYLEIPCGLRHETDDNEDTPVNTMQETSDSVQAATDKDVKNEVGQISFNIFDESYIDWIKQEKSLLKRIQMQYL